MPIFVKQVIHLFKIGNLIRSFLIFNNFGKFPSVSWNYLVSMHLFSIYSIQLEGINAFHLQLWWKTAVVDSRKDTFTTV